MKTIYKLLFMVLIIINLAMLSCYGNEYYELVWLPEAMKESVFPYSDGYISESKNKENSNAVLYTSYAAQKSPGKAFILSAIIPGIGELYAENKRGIAFMVTEAVFWLTYFVLHGKANDLKDNYLVFVDANIMFEADSPVKSTATWTLEDYEHSTQSDNWHYVYTENNGNPIPRVGKFYWKDLPEDKINEPAGELVSNSPLRLEAYQKRMSSNTKFKRAKLYLGLVVVNHIVSAIDARIAAMSYNKQIVGNDIKISLLPAFFASNQFNTSLVLSRAF